jgi:hypothetical protein
MQEASLGRIVLAKVDPRQNNGSDEAPAVIVAVNDDDTVNLRALLDGDANLWLTKVKLVDERPDDDDEDVETNVSGVQRVAYWPPRV